MEKIGEDVLKRLREWNIPFEALEHEKVHAIGECYEKIPLNWENTVMPRNVLACNRQQTTFYLFLMRPETPFRTSYASHALGSSRLSFAPEEKLRELLSCASGAVSPLGLMWDEGNQVQLVMDEDLKEIPFYAFHPCDAGATVTLSAQDFLKGFLEKAKKSVCWMQMPKEETL